MTVIYVAVTLAGVFALVASLTYLHLAPTGLSPVRNPVSQYALTPYRAGYAVAALGAALAGVAMAFVIATIAPSATIALALLAVFTAARALIPFFPMDAPDAPTTRAGSIHSVLAVAAFATVTAAAFFASVPLAQAGAAQLASLATWTGVVMAVGSAGILLSRASSKLHAVFGLAERLIYLGFIVWFAATAIIVGWA